MKKLITLTLIATIFAFTGGLQAQDKTSATNKKHAVKNKKQKDLLKDVNLTKDQKSQVKLIVSDMKTRKHEIKTNASISAEEKRSALQKLAGEERNRIYQLLTFEQKQQIASKNSAYAEMRMDPQPVPRRGVTNLPNERTSK